MLVYENIWFVSSNKKIASTFKTRGQSIWVYNNHEDQITSKFLTFLVYQCKLIKM